MGVPLTAVVTESGDVYRIDLQGEGGELLLSQRGEPLKAVQHIVSTAFRRQLGEDGRVLVDCQHFRRDKDNELQQMARFLASKALRTGAPQEIGPLNAYRAAHRAPRGGRRRRQLGKRRRRRGQDGHHQPQVAPARAAADVFHDRYDRGHRDGGRPRRHRRRAHQRPRSAGGGRRRPRADPLRSAPSRHIRATSARRRARERGRPRGGDVLSRPALVHDRRHGRNQRAREPGGAGVDSRGLRAPRRPARGARRVHVSRLCPRPDRADAGGSRRRPRRRRYAVAGTQRLRPAGGLPGDGHLRPQRDAPRPDRAARGLAGLSGGGVSLHRPGGDPGDDRHGCGARCAPCSPVPTRAG